MTEFWTNLTNENLKVVASLLGPMVTLGGFYFLHRQLKLNGKNLEISLENAARNNAEYLKSQRWKEIEFVAEQVDKFFDDTENRIILRIFDWKRRSIVLTIGQKTKVVTIDRLILRNALRLNAGANKFTAVEASIRDLMDHFLAEMGRFYHYISAGTIKKEDIDPYIVYWMDLLHGRKSNIMDIDTLSDIWSYIEFYNFESVKSLLLLYGERPVVPDGGKMEISENIAQEAQR